MRRTMSSWQSEEKEESKHLTELLKQEQIMLLMLSKIWKKIVVINRQLNYSIIKFNVPLFSLKCICKDNIQNTPKLQAEFFEI